MILYSAISSIYFNLDYLNNINSIQKKETLGDKESSDKL